MKIKKSELLALIKEEIMDDPSDDNTIPAEMKKEGATPWMEVDTVDFSPRHPAAIDRLELAGFDLSGMRRHNGGFRITLNKEEAAKLRDHMAKNPSAFFESKKGQNTMKIKKSELLALIKEEIMAEAEMFKMSEDDLLDIIKEIMMDRPGRKPQDMANEALGKLMSKMRGGGAPYGAMQEGIENINAENMQVVADALQKMAPLIGVMSLPVLIGLIYEQLKSMGAK